MTRESCPGRHGAMPGCAHSRAAPGGLPLQVGADASWNWDRKYWEDAYNSAIQNINHVSYRAARQLGVRVTDGSRLLR